MTSNPSWTREPVRRLGVALAGAMLLLCAAGCTSQGMADMRARVDASMLRAREQAAVGWSPQFEETVNRRIRPSQYRLEPLMSDPAPDEAATARGWETIAYHYPNGATVAYPTYNWNYE